MISSILLMLSQYNKNSKMANIFKCLWIIVAMIISVINFNSAFLLVEIASFLLTTGCIRLANRFGSKINTCLSVISILIYSIFVDTVCYFVLPAWSENQSLIQYITGGLIFNSKYAIINIVVLAAIVSCSYFLKKLSKRALVCTNGQI